MGAGSRPLCQEGRPPGRTHVRREGHQEGHINHLGDSKGSKEVTSVTTTTTKTTQKTADSTFFTSELQMGGFYYKLTTQVRKIQQL